MLMAFGLGVGLSLLWQSPNSGLLTISSVGAAAITLGFGGAVLFSWRYRRGENEKLRSRIHDLRIRAIRLAQETEAQTTSYPKGTSELEGEIGRLIDEMRLHDLRGT